MYQVQKKPTMRSRLTEMEQNEAPRFVRGNNATPTGVGNADDVAWAIAQEFEKFMYDEGIPSGKNSAWLFKRGQYAVDKSRLRRAYSAHPDKFRDGTGKQLTLADFGRRMVRYFKRNAGWGYCSGGDDVIGMFYDPVVLDDIMKALWRVYEDRRVKRGL